jgi:hypothetical protein
LFRSASASAPSVNQGFATVEPYFDQSGNLVLNYPLDPTPTAQCPNGTNSIITFNCRTTSLVCIFIGLFSTVTFLQGEPSYAGADSCTTYFLWSSSAACPQKAIAGSPCSVTDLTSGFTYNVSSLRSAQDYSFQATVLGKVYTYKLNICGPLVGGCGNATNASGCQIFSNAIGQTNYAVIGTPSTTLSLNNGVVSSVNSGGSLCNLLFSQKARSFTYNFICDPTTNGQQGPDFVGELPICSYNFNWRTNLVCSAPPPVSCAYEDRSRNIFIDMSPLRNSDFNWEYTDPATGSTYVINVCQPLIPDSVCALAFIISSPFFSHFFALINFAH